MLRCTVSRRISRFNFGQPDMYSGFKGSLFVKPTTTLPDTGIHTSTLPNGVKVVTHDQGGATSTVGVYVEAGAKFDPAYAPGMSHVMRFAILGSNFHNSLFQIDRAMRSVGASYNSTDVNKRFIGWTAAMSRGSYASPLEHLLTCVACPRLSETDIERFRDTMDNILEERRWQHPRDYCVDQAESVAFNRERLGSPRFVPPFANDASSAEKLLNQYCSYFLPSRVTVVGVNVAHDELVANYNGGPYPHSASAPHHAGAKPAQITAADELKQYTGGRDGYEQEKREKEMSTKPNMEKETIAAIAFPSAGLDSDLPSYASTLVLRELINVAQQDGIHYLRHESHCGGRSFYRPFSTAGLIGITIRDKPDAVYDALKTLVQLNADIKDLAAAKVRAEIAFHHDHLEAQKDYTNFLVSSPHKVEDVIAAIRNVSEKEVSRAYDLAKSQAPCLFATGETMKLPSMHQLLRK